ncbi:hypothetical protein [Nocardia jiangsuensis]|uniref:Uncharacterized protein n=1 Tax=Nocardia jiangsuensis TaxID=1691563 RepID=A0ABV8DRQ2_9NOCA
MTTMIEADSVEAENLPERAFGRPADWHPGSPWWDAGTVLVTHEVLPGRRETRKRLVVPAGDGRLAFRVSSWSPEVEQLVRDPRVIVQAGDWRGARALGSREQQGEALIFGEGSVLDTVREGIRIKYGVRGSLARWGHRMARGSAPFADLAVVVSVHENDFPIIH